MLTSGPSLIAPADVFVCLLRSRYALLTDSSGCQDRVGTSVAVSARASSWRKASIASARKLKPMIFRTAGLRLNKRMCMQDRRIVHAEFSKIRARDGRRRNKRNVNLPCCSFARVVRPVTRWHGRMSLPVLSWSSGAARRVLPPCRRTRRSQAKLARSRKGARRWWTSVSVTPVLSSQAAPDSRTSVWEWVLRATSQQWCRAAGKCGGGSSCKQGRQSAAGGQRSRTFGRRAHR